MGRKIAIGTVVVGLLSLPATAAAATITVTTASDSSASQCTLRDAIDAADSNSASGACPAGEPAPVTDTIQFSLPGPSTITLGSPLPGVLKAGGPVAIVGPGAGQLTISGANAYQGLYFGIDATASLSGVTVTEGRGIDGGGIVNYGTLTVEGVAVTDSVVSEVGGSNVFPVGGGIYSNGPALTLRRSTVTGNSAIGSGASNQNDPWAGGIFNHDGVLTIEDSTISGNSAKAVAGPGGTSFAQGAGIANEIGQLVIRRSTISGNTSVASGSSSHNQAETGGIANGNAATTSETIEDSTISGNVATALGTPALTQAGGMTFYGSPGSITSSTIVGNSAAVGANLVIFTPTTVRNTIIADPHGGGQNCANPVASAGFNIEDGSSCKLTQPSDRQNTDPLLSPAGLADNGGPTPTIALEPGSPAVNQGLSGPGETTDQRGLSRPFLWPGVPIVNLGSNGADVGAFELQPLPMPVTPGSPGPPPAAPPPAARLSGGNPRVHVSCSQSAKPGGCKLALQVFSAKPHRAKHKGKRGRARPPVAESAIARVKLASGKSALVTLQPKPKFAAKLAAATKLLVRETETAKGKTSTTYRRLKVVR